MNYKMLKVEKEDGLLWMTMNRPDRLNAINLEMLMELLDFFESCRNDKDSRVIIIRGEGKGFCAGADVAGLERNKSEEEYGELSGYFSSQQRLAYMIELMREIPQPLIAAIRGPAVGGGMCIALACDIRIAGESTRFQPSFLKRGYSACDGGTSYFLPRLIGVSRASEFLLTGRFIDAETADKTGLVSKVVPDDQVENAAGELAAEIMQNAPIGVRLTKEVLSMNIDAPSLKSALHLENRTQVMASFSEDQKEAVSSFLEKRDPVFKYR